MTARDAAGNPVAEDGALPQALIVAGPTASGKSALALGLARRMGGTVINADSMQLYRELRVLTARPAPAEEALAPHALYGVLPAAEAGSAAWWRGAALAAMDVARAAGRLPILCGGTGLYFHALRHGLADIPEPGAAARQEARALLQAIGPAALHARLMAADPETAATVRPSDGQRVARAWEVWRGTGQGLAAWVRAARPEPAPWRFSAILLLPPRDALRAAIAARFQAMLASGAVAEVAALRAQNLSPALPAMRAHGVPELCRYLDGAVSLAEAEAAACRVTAQYTKRQATWFRHHDLADPARTRILLARVASDEQDYERILADMQNFLRFRD